MSDASEYFVLGWKTDPTNGSSLVFENTKSIEPGADVEQAMALGSRLVTVDSRKGESVEQIKREHIEIVARHGIRDATGRYYDPPLKDGVLTFSVQGFMPTGKFHPRDKGRMLQRIAFKVRVSANPRRDVERALRFGCPRVLIGANYEPTEHEKLEQEELDKQEEGWRRRRE